MKKINVGILGYGNISSKHVQAIKDNNKFKLLSICDTDVNYDGQTRFRKFDEMLRVKKEIDLIAILSPSGDHYKHIIKSLKNKKHVIVEKPLCMNLKEVYKLEKYEKKYKKKVFVVYQNRLNPLIELTKEKISKNILGKIILFSSNLYWNRDEKYFLKSKWRGKKKRDGGIAMNQGIHNLDIFYNFFGKVKSLNCIKTKIKNYIECEDTSIITFVFKNGIIGNFILSTAVNKENYSNSIEIFGTQKNIKLYGKNLDTLSYQKKISKFENDAKLHSKFYYEVGQSILKRKKNLFSIESTLHSMEIIEAINKSMKMNTKVYL